MHEKRGYRTGRLCITPGCYKPAGTAWSPYWCAECNAERMERITRNLEQIAADMAEGGAEGEGE